MHMCMEDDIHPCPVFIWHVDRACLCESGAAIVDVGQCSVPNLNNSVGSIVQCDIMSATD